jgi:hypothetical protein
MPGLDFVVSAMARAGMFRLSVGQTAPIVNQDTTVWFKPSVPSWVAEGTVWLWDASAGAYALATPSLWNNLLSPSAYVFQSVAVASGVVTAGTSLVAVQRVAPSVTVVMLPNLLAQWRTGRALKVVDWSTGVVEHAIALTTPDGATIMQQTSWQLFSSADQLAGITLQPAPNLNGWVIAP